jgi:hypothetical protein
MVMANKASVGEVRAWAKKQGFEVADRGRLPAEVWNAWNSSVGSAPVPQQRASDPEPPVATVEALEAAHARIDRLEQQVAELTETLAGLASRPAEPRRLFARAR